MKTGERSPFEKVGVAPDEGTPGCPQPFRHRVMVDAIHDGAHIPTRFLCPDDEGPLCREAIEKHFVRERDWGAELVAACLASALHLDGYYRVNTARALMDFGRFPGITPKSADFMERFAINYPFSERLAHAQKQAVLEDHYDQVSIGMDAAIRGTLLKVGVHTYDPKNHADTMRPPVSIVTRSHSHSKGSMLPLGAFDPVFPHQLAEFTCDRLLRSRIGLELEESGIRVAGNYPYALPEGSVEVRAQVWFFFEYLRERYDARHPAPENGGSGRSPRQLVWDMLLDTNLRNTYSEALRGYLHMFRRPPKAAHAEFEQVRAEYEQLLAFVDAERDGLIADYRSSPERPSALLLEIRKDLVADLSREGQPPCGLHFEDAQLIARTVAAGIRQWFIIDRVARARARESRDRRFY